jgi:hypothetical protein
MMMPKQILILFAVLLLCGLVACTAQPKPSTLVSSGTRNSLAAARAPVNAKLVMQGYVVRLRRGEYQYCKNEIQTASRLYTTVCLTEAELKRQEEDTRAFLESLDRRTMRCTPQGCVRR